MTTLEQLRLAPERCDEPATALHGAKVPAGACLEISEVTGAEVRHGMVFEISPDVFNRVELGSIGGQILQGDLSIQTFQVLLHESRTVRLKPIPDYEQLFADRRCECLQELHDLWTLDRAGEESKVEAPEAHSSNHRQLLPGKAVLQDWCLAPWAQVRARQGRSDR